MKKTEILEEAKDNLAGYAGRGPDEFELKWLSKALDLYAERIIEQVMPEEHPKHCPDETNFCRGWLACRDQMLKNIDEV